MFVITTLALMFMRNIGLKPEHRSFSTYIITVCIYYCPGSKTGQALRERKNVRLSLLHVSTASNMGSQHVVTRVHRHVC